MTRCWEPQGGKAGRGGGVSVGRSRGVDGWVSVEKAEWEGAGGVLINEKTEGAELEC